VTDSLFEQYKAALRRGHLAALAGDLDGALEAYRTAARLVPERSLPVASQGTVLHRLDRWPEAAEAFDLALRMSPDDEAALRARATARAERGLRSGAAADFERLAFVLDVASRSAEAAEAARRAAELDPSTSRELLADRLRIAAAHVADMLPPAAGAASTPDSTDASDAAMARMRDAVGGADTAPAAQDVDAGAAEAASFEAAADLEAISARLHRFVDTDAFATEPASESPTEPIEPEPVDAEPIDAEPMDAELVDDGPIGEQAAALAARLAELGTQPAWVDKPGRSVGAHAADGGTGVWPLIDLPSPPPPPIEGPPPDPETLLAEAADCIAAGDLAGARDRMLVAAIVHRSAGRLDAALEICLQLLTTAPGDPHVHLAIANLQLDRGWTDLATEKIALLRRLTSLTGDTQAEADVHGLASERLRDDAASSAHVR
jgi:tetratricopeptide (TPR) repeat protein